MYYQKIANLIESKQYTKALEYIDEQLLVYTEDDGLYYSRSLVLAHLRRYDEAIDCINRAIALDPEICNYQLQKAELFISNKNTSESLRILKSTIPNNQKDQCRKIILEAKLKLYQNDFLMMQAKCKRALAIDPDNKHAMNLLTNSLVCQGKYEEAETFNLQVLEKYPLDDFAKFHLSIIHLGMNEDKEAEEEILHALSMNPNDRSLHLGLKKVLLSKSSLFKWVYKIQDFVGRKPQLINAVYFLVSIVIIFSFLFASDGIGLDGILKGLLFSILLLSLPLKTYLLLGDFYVFQTKFGKSILADEKKNAAIFSLVCFCLGLILALTSLSIEPLFLPGLLLLYLSSKPIDYYFHFQKKYRGISKVYMYFLFLMTISFLVLNQNLILLNLACIIGIVIYSVLLKEFAVTNLT